MITGGEQNPGLPRNLVTAQEASKQVYIEANLLREMALEGKVPCCRVAGGEPLFHRPTLSRFLREHYFQEQEGVPEPTPLRLAVVMLAPRAPVARELPIGLRAMEKQLAEYAPHFFQPCVYFLIRGDEVVYVGQTVSLPTRIADHALGTHSTTQKDFDRVVYLPVPQKDLLQVEAVWIRALDPILNRRAERSPEEAEARLQRKLASVR